MTKLYQSRRRSPLFEGNAALSFTRSVDPSREHVVGLTMDSQTETPGGKAIYFTLDMPLSEYDRAAKFVRDHRPAHEYQPTEDAKLMGEREFDIDAERQLSAQEQLAKALDFAFTMLKVNMPHDDQDGNCTLAYIKAVHDASSVELQRAIGKR